MRITNKYTHFFIFLLILISSRIIFAGEEILVFAAIGARQPLNEIGEKFEAETGIEVVYNYGGTGHLANKILAGLNPAVFIAGSEKWQSILTEKKLITKSWPVVKHVPVLAVNKKKTEITQFSDITSENLSLVLGEKKACAIGEVCERIFESAKINSQDLQIVARGVTVKQLMLWLENGMADASIVWNADAVQSEQLKIITIPEEYNQISIIPVYLMNNAPETAQRFIDFVLTDGKPIFEKFHFQTF